MQRRRVRVAFVAALVVSVSVVAYGVATADRSGTAADVPEAPPREGVTVATESARYGTIMAWHPNGSRLYYDDTRTKYFDVDRIPGTMTVEYAATDTIHTEGPTCSSPPCALNVIERANLSTGATEVVYARYDHSQHAAEWHDHERVNGSHVLIADMIDDRVVMVDTETELVDWAWDAQAAYPVEGGGPYPEDWAHLNDVDLLPDGRVMASLRNQDQVVFIDPERGVQNNWTLGSEDDHETLYEQHNPDYIPESQGGPSVLVADSENARIVEYQRENGSWTRSWQWADARLQWPRDADRLPNGNTLVADTHGSRLLEVAPNGTVAWSVPLAHPYDVERFGTGEDSTGGESAARLGLTAQTAAASDERDGGSVVDAISEFVKRLPPTWVVNGVLYVAPVWMGREQYFAVGLAVGVAVVWPALELRWRFTDLSVRSPVYRAGDDSGRTTDDSVTERPPEDAE
jgi:hypothetical protein